MSVVRDVFVDFGHFQLDIPKLSLLDKGITALVGPSGSGKTTFLKVLLGLQKCSSFSWTFKGKELGKVPSEKRQLGVVFQENDVFPHFTVEQNMRFAGNPRHKSKQGLEKLFDRVSKALDITHLLGQKARHLSGGERQRLALANALMSRPHILLLDEPFSCLDRERHESARLLIRHLIEEFDIPAVMVTHDLQDINHLSNFVITISAGRLA